jgi:hypothetical protein
MKESCYLRDLDVDEIGHGLDSTGFGKIQWWDLVNTVMKFLFL